MSILLACVLYVVQEQDYRSQLDAAWRDLDSGRLRSVCRKIEEAARRRPDDPRVRSVQIDAYLLAGAEPLIAEVVSEVRKLDPRFRPDLPNLTVFEEDDRFEMSGCTVRRFRNRKTGERYDVFFRDSSYAYYFVTRGKGLYLQVGGFQALRLVDVLGSTQKPGEALARCEQERPILEAAELAVERARLDDRGGEILQQAARELAAAVERLGPRPGLLEELSWLYDRLGERVTGTSAESEYRRLQFLSALRLREAAPGLPPARRMLALSWFRMGAVPLAASEAAAAGEDAEAAQLLGILRSWGQDRYELSERFEAAPGISVERYRNLRSPPETALLFQEQVFVARHAKRPDLMVFTLSSQRLKDRRHFYLHGQALADRALLVSYGSSRPEEDALRRTIVDLIASLLDKSPGPEK